MRATESDPVLDVATALGPIASLEIFSPAPFGQSFQWNGLIMPHGAPRQRGRDRSREAASVKCIDRATLENHHRAVPSGSRSRVRPYVTSLCNATFAARGFRA